MLNLEHIIKNISNTYMHLYHNCIHVLAYIGLESPRIIRSGPVGQTSRDGIVWDIFRQGISIYKVTGEGWSGQLYQENYNWKQDLNIHNTNYLKKAGSGKYFLKSKYLYRD